MFYIAARFPSHFIMNKNIFYTLNSTHMLIKKCHFSPELGLKWHFLINISIDVWPFQQNEKK